MSSDVLLERVVDATPVRVAMLRPPTVVLVGSLSYVGPIPPVGMAYVAAALRGAGHDVQVLDAPAEALEQFEHFDAAIGRIRRIGLTPRQLVDRIRPGTKVIGISHLFAHEWPTVRQIAELAKERFPDAAVVVGGENATGFWRWMLDQCPSIDAIVQGEGEATAVELVGRVSRGMSLNGMSGVAFRSPIGEEVLDGGLRTRLRKAEVDEVARPAWDLFPMEAYFAYPSFLGVDHGRSMPIMATRGCPYSCTFCSAPRMWTSRYVVRDPEDVADEIADYVERYGIRNVDFVDLTPIAKRSAIIGLCEAIERRGLDVSLQFPIGTRSEAIDAEVLRALKAAGCRNITFAPESGSRRLLEKMDKRADLDVILNAIRLADRLGLETNMHMMIGHPEETWRDRWLTWRYMLRAASVGLGMSGLTLFHPYPGSADFRSLVESGELEVDDDYCYDGLGRGGQPSQAFNRGVGPRLLHLSRIAMFGSVVMVTHLRHPRRLLHFLRTALFGGQELTWLEQAVRTRRRGPLSTKARGLVRPPRVVEPDDARELVEDDQDQFGDAAVA